MPITDGLNSLAEALPAMEESAAAPSTSEAAHNVADNEKPATAHEDTMLPVLPAASNTPRVTLDYSVFPHIIDLVIAHSTRASLIPLRLTCKYFDKLVASHYNTHYVVHLATEHVPARPDDYDTWPETLSSEERNRRVMQNLTCKTLPTPADTGFDRAIHCSVGHHPPGSVSDFQHMRVLDIHEMPEPEMLALWKHLIVVLKETSNKFDGPQIVRLCNVDEDHWGGQLSIEAPTVVIFLPTSNQMCSMLGWNDMLTIPPTGVDKLVINMAVIADGPAGLPAFISLMHICLFFRIPEALKEMVIIVTPVRSGTPACTGEGIVKTCWIEAILEAVNRGITHTKFTIVDYPRHSILDFLRQLLGRLCQKHLEVTDDDRKNRTVSEAFDVAFMRQKDHLRGMVMTGVRFHTLEQYAAEVGAEQFKLETVEF